MTRLKQYAVRDAKYNTYFSGVDLDIAGFDSKEKALEFAAKVKDIVGESRSVTVMDHPTASGDEKAQLKQDLTKQIGHIQEINDDILEHKQKLISDPKHETFWFYNGDLATHFENFRKLHEFLCEFFLEIQEG